MDSDARGSDWQRGVGPPTGGGLHGKPVIAVVGAGAGGVLAVCRLLGRAPAGASVRLVDGRLSTGRGPAYGTTDPGHRLNVAVARMSADPDDPDGFLRWVRRTKSRHVAVSDYVPRMWFGEYLESQLSASAASSPASLHRITDEVFSIRPSAGRYRVRLRHGLSFIADVVLLALGEPASNTSWLPESVTGHPSFCADPWDPQLLHRSTVDADRVLLLGAGLTMIDIATSLDRRDRRLIALSRTGLLPAVHADKTPDGILPPPSLPAGRITLGEAEGVVSGQVQLAQREFDDWRPGIDSLRPITDELWQRLSVAEQREFATRGRRRWEVLRHRMAPDSAQRIDQMRHDGRLVALTGQIAEVRCRGEGFRVRLADRTRLQVDAIVNCTGPGIPEQIRDAGNPLVADLVSRGQARINAQGLGLDTDGQGRVISGRGQADPGLFVIGAYRRGPIWETTAIPQIRVQAQECADEALALLAPRIGAPRAQTAGVTEGVRS